VPDKPLQKQEEVEITNTALAEKRPLEIAPLVPQCLQMLQGHNRRQYKGTETGSGGRVFVQGMEDHSL